MQVLATPQKIALFGIEAVFLIVAFFKSVRWH